MARVDAGGKPIIDVDGGKVDIGEAKEQIRRRMRGSGRIHLTWNAVLPRLVITSDTTDFDRTTLSHFQAEGFQLSYLPYDGDHKDYHNKLQHLQDPLELGDKYAIVGM